MSYLTEADFEENTIALMAMRSPEAHAGRGLDVSYLRQRITERQKHRLFMRLDALFKAWTGESFIAFIIRRNAARHTAEPGRSRGSDGGCA